ncbi:ribonuclease P protein component [Entomospira culicis]|uniref:Ribonuclease P protein component n=1 Tax=Entomospira culicis TaxID=2719989 RepID=A0A968GHN4_9SPIO|nr:ribonuclease P protein component [Entomospira culicis]NIZ68820.1 ribonuclease P protein component [Entomospira culicis]
MKKNLTKRVRLNKQTFKLTLQQGKRLRYAQMTIFYRENQLSIARYGVGVGRKYGNAVQRNRAKRLLREALNKVYLHILSSYDIVVLVYDKELSLSSCANQLSHMFERLGIINRDHDEALTYNTDYSSPVE